jgi:hypothetical protein
MNQPSVRINLFKLKIISFDRFKSTRRDIFGVTNTYVITIVVVVVQ